MGGMIGSAKGWLDAGYVATPASVNDIIDNLTSFKLPWGADAHIVSGVYHQFKDGNFNVMRGEEIQIFGAGIDNGFIILPGTHSKHSLIKNGSIEAYDTFMTGEMFSVLKESILRKGLPTQTFDKSVFIKGVIDSNTSSIMSTLFNARTRVLFDLTSEESIDSYISGLLIGYELNHAHTKTITLIGSRTLCDIYAIASRHLDFNVTYLDGDTCFLRGIARLMEKKIEYK
jgi:2-dehydro-3-deoxygalactonokinase